LRNSQFTFDQGSGRIKFEWVYPADNIHVAFVLSQVYDVQVASTQEYAGRLTKWDGIKWINEKHYRPV